MTVVIDANILIAYGLADEPFHTQANQLLYIWQTAQERLSA
jgi:predicted nucleic acid-binding protein